MGPSIENDDIYKDISPTVGRALSNIEQRAFGGNLEGFTFGGTNVILENNRIIFIKDDTPSEGLMLLQSTTSPEPCRNH